MVHPRLLGHWSVQMPERSTSAGAGVYCLHVHVHDPGPIHLQASARSRIRVVPLLLCRPSPGPGHRPGHPARLAAALVIRCPSRQWTRDSGTGKVRVQDSPGPPRPPWIPDGAGVIAVSPRSTVGWCPLATRRPRNLSRHGHQSRVQSSGDGFRASSSSDVVGQRPTRQARQVGVQKVLARVSVQAFRPTCDTRTRRRYAPG